MRAGVLVAGAAIALTAAGPAHAADGLVPPEPLLPDPTLALPAPAPATEPVVSTEPPSDTVEPPVVSVTQTEPGSVDVSVRVLSPGTDGSLPQEESGYVVISAPHAPDITDAGDTAAAAPDASPMPLVPTGTNANVSVRVLSPGDSDLVSQSAIPSTAPVGAEQDDGAHDAPRTVSPDNDTKQATESDAQYHGEDSRYQSPSVSSDSPWDWTWYLARDCSGEVVSTSAESGAPSSLDWSWNWTWVWECDSPEDPPPIDGALPQGEATSSPDDSWAWAWTFTFCDETASLAAQIPTDSALRWTWNWTWEWTCEAGEPAQAAPAPTLEASAPLPAAEQTTGESDAVTGAPQSTALPALPGAPQPTALPPLPFVPVLPVLPELALPVIPPVPTVVVPGSPPAPAVVAVDTPAPVAPTLEISISISIPSPGASLETAAGALPAPPPVGTTSLPQEPDAASRGPGRAAPAPGSTAPAALPATPTQPGADAPRAAEEHPPARRQARDARRPLSPPPLQAAGATGASGGFAPSGSVLGAAVLLAFLLLAAPGLGRRIGSARELSPRGVDGSSIDHPG